MKELKKLIVNGDTYIITDEGTVAYDTAQALSAQQQLQARQNIDAASATDMESEIDRLDSRISAIGSSDPGTGTGGAAITVDSELSPTSENPVQNKVITQLFLEAQATLAGLTPDAALDAESTRPVQNKVICEQWAASEATLAQTFEQIVAMIPTEDAISALIDAKLGLIENGAY